MLKFQNETAVNILFYNKVGLLMVILISCLNRFVIKTLH